MANKIVQLKDGDDNLYPLSVMVQPGAEVVSGAWVATTTSAALTRVTDRITVTKGVWLVYAQTPTQNAVMSFTFRPGAGSSIDVTAQNYFSSTSSGMGQGMIICTVLVDSTTIELQSAGSSTVNYSNLDRGWIKGVKLYDSYTDTGVATDYIVAQGTSDIWTYRKWASGVAECWGTTSVASSSYVSGGSKNITQSLPSGLFIRSPHVVMACGRLYSVVNTDIGFTAPNSKDEVQTYLINRGGSTVTAEGEVYWNIKGNWK